MYEGRNDTRQEAIVRAVLAQVDERLAPIIQEQQQLLAMYHELRLQAREILATGQALLEAVRKTQGES